MNSPCSRKFSPAMAKILLIIMTGSVLLLFMLPAYAAETKRDVLPKEAVKALFLAQQAANEKDYDKAIKVLNEYMNETKEPIPLQAYQMIGSVYYQKGEKDKALKAYARAHEAFPQEVEILQNYAALSFETGRSEEAARLLEKFYRSKGKTDKKLLYQVAGLYFQARKLDEAKRVLTELLTSGGEVEAKWYDDMIGLCVELKEWQEAEKWTLAFLENHPAQSKYWRLIAQIRLDREQYKPAASALEIAYRLEPPKPKDWLDLADLYLYLNAPLMAIRCMRSAYEGEIPDDRKAKIASLYARTGRIDQALKTFDEILVKNPSAGVLFEKGRLLYEAMRYTESIAVLGECVHMDPKQGEAYMLMAFAAWNIKNWEKARKSFVAASALPKFRNHALDCIAVMDDLIAAMAEDKGSE